MANDVDTQHLACHTGTPLRVSVPPLQGDGDPLCEQHFSRHQNGKRQPTFLAKINILFHSCEGDPA